MATCPDPDRIDPHAPPEAPPAPLPAEEPPAEPPGLIPETPDIDRPGEHPGEWGPPA